jgi:tagatose-1,6-bisphosphate aldolase non-catalytic subunit AgaZ/GatZ
MAFVTVRDATVVNRNGKGGTIVETYIRNGEEAKSYYKVWTDEPLPEGKFDVSGILSVRVSEYEGNVRAEVHINKPRFKVGEDSQAVYRGSQSWSNPGVSALDDSPF